MLKQADIRHIRLRNQHILRPRFDDPAELVRWFGAVQAQDYFDSLWAVGLRTRGALKARVEKAIAERTIVRTWPMRGTLHFVAPNDIHWMLQLLTPRVIAANATRYRQLELDDAVFTRSEKVIVAALRETPILTRRALYDRLNAAGIATAENRSAHISGYLAQRGIICFGPHIGKQATFVLLDEWVPNARRLARPEALVELAQRYIMSHGPATIHDLAWWSGLTIADARLGLEGAAALRADVIDGRTHWFAPAPRITRSDTPKAYLLPAWDEYTVAYRDRGAVLDPAHAKQVNAGGGILKPVVVVDGQVVGAWKRSAKDGTLTITVTPFARVAKPHWDAIELAAQRYGRFLGAVTQVQQG